MSPDIIKCQQSRSWRRSRRLHQFESNKKHDDDTQYIYRVIQVALIDLYVAWLQCTEVSRHHRQRSGKGPYTARVYDLALECLHITMVDVLPSHLSPFQDRPAMFSLSCVVLFGHVFHAIPASPLPNHVKREAGTLKDLSNEFRGIKWDLVFQPDNCTSERLDKIIYATRASQWMLELPAPDGAYVYTTAWSRYFGNYAYWIVGRKDSQGVAASIERRY
jgi:hypothetical protein